ncbi:MAG: hypothetical protein KDB00_00705 [Planctomycetales bacterium]|nr:hypothetical protein [Planctomycetales bacterium]
MPWPTTNGLRNLDGAEADLVRGAVGMMVDTHVSEIRDGAETWLYGVSWFDQWDAGQRLWLLQRVCSAFLGDETIEPSAAIFDATVDAIFCEIIDLVRIEIQQGTASQDERRTCRQSSWRQSVIEAYRCQNDRPPEIDALSVDLPGWNAAVSVIADSILGVRLYQRAEPFRDGDYQQMERFLRDRGLPEDYLTAIPPLRSAGQIQQSIDQIQRFVFDE